MVTKQEFDEWLQDSVTVALKQQIRKDIENMKEMLISVDEYDLKELQGRIKASINLVNVQYEDLFDEK